MKYYHKKVLIRKSKKIGKFRILHFYSVKKYSV